MADLNLRLHEKGLFRRPANVCGYLQIWSSIIVGPGKFDPRHSGELLKHMDKQNEVLVESYRTMLHECQKLQVEEEMLMRKLYGVMSVHGDTKQNEDNSHNTAGAEKSSNVVNSTAHEEQKGQF